MIVANLKPTRIRRVESQGLLLCASAGKQLALIPVDGEFLEPGVAVK